MLVYTSASSAAQTFRTLGDTVSGRAAEILKPVPVLPGGFPPGHLMVMLAWCSSGVIHDSLNSLPHPAGVISSVAILSVCDFFAALIDLS